MGRQVFLINSDGTTTEIETDGPIKDSLETDESYVIVDDDLRKVFLWKGVSCSVRSKFIGAKRAQDIRGQIGMHYSVVPLDEGDEDDDFLDIIGGKTEAGIAKEITQDEPRQQASRQTQGGGGGGARPASGMSPAGSGGSSNSGPLYTGQQSMTTMAGDEQQVNFEQIMEKLEEIAIPEGYERELIIIGNHAYSVVEKTQNFLGKKQVEKVIEKVGSIPEGVFFAKDYSPRVLSENQRIIAIEFLKRTGQARAKKEPENPDEKKNILKDQLKQQLG